MLWQPRGRRRRSERCPSAESSSRRERRSASGALPTVSLRCAPARDARLELVAFGHDVLAPRAEHVPAVVEVTGAVSVSVPDDLVNDAHQDHRVLRAIAEMDLVREDAVEVHAILRRQLVPCEDLDTLGVPGHRACDETRARGTVERGRARPARTEPAGANRDGEHGATDRGGNG